jgi:beta-glucosidase
MAVQILPSLLAADYGALAADIAAECMVLLKNEKNLLPLAKDEQVAFIGEFAEKPRFQGGGSSHINSFKTTSALEAAKEAGLQVVYARGYSVKEDAATEAQIAEAVAAAKAARVAVVFAGLPDAYESEGYDRKNMNMPACQNQLIEAVAAANPNTVVVLHNGAPVAMPWIDRVEAVLEAYLGGQAVGLAEVKVLFGDVNPSGHLPITFYRNVEDLPAFEDYQMKQRTYRYFTGEVLYPFGMGLSYTSWKIAGARKDGDSVIADIANQGEMNGDAVVQVYVKCDSDDAPLFPRLCGFGRIHVQAGKTERIRIPLDRLTDTVVNEAGERVHVSRMKLFVGMSQPDEKSVRMAGVQPVELEA